MPSNTGLGIDVGTTGGSWLFKQGDLLLGPVPFTKLVDLLYAGDVDGDTPVALHGPSPSFRRIGEIPAFKVHLAKAGAKLRVEAQSQEIQTTERRGRLLRTLFGGLLTLLVVAGGAQGAWWLAIHRPWERKLQLPDPVITDELPKIALASKRGEEELAYPTGKTPKAGTPARHATAKQPGKGSKAGAESAAAKQMGAGGKAAEGSKPDEDGLTSVQEWDRDAINGVIRSSKKSLHGCLTAEAHRQRGGWTARIPIEFTIGNDGRVAKLWIDNLDYKSEESELFKCMLVELKKWKFPSYQGEQANVGLAFNIAAPGK